MAINFDKLPTERSSANIVAPGIYKFEIIKAEMRPAYDAADPDFLGINMKLTTLDNKVAGFLNDKIVENPKPQVGYKIQRLIRATGLELEGTVELKDIGKLLVGCKGFVDVTTFTTPEGREISIVNLFDHDCYYSKKERAVVESIVNGNSAPITIEDIIEEESPVSNAEEEDDY